MELLEEEVREQLDGWAASIVMVRSLEGVCGGGGKGVPPSSRAKKGGGGL